MDGQIKVVVRYDGTAFAGWQVQPGERTVQGELESALSRMASRRVRIHGASRTDAGVHALGQVFNCAWPADYDLARLRRSLCTMLGRDIRVESVAPAPPGFHARKSAKSKRYLYSFDASRYPDPLSTRYSWCIPWEIDREYVASLARRLVGTHDFGGFQGGGAQVSSTVRTIYSIELRDGGLMTPREGGRLWGLEYHGDGFLYKMVRNLTGSLIDVARGRVAESRLDELLAGPSPFHGHTAPAHGLALLEVLY